eukprot:TRINITY_DN7275_c0_g1_i4.p1 TRINITY_DN7275_c0_g1~~TRINITY_DN7275_c0_g1_i4.p1  ORF type:complete len:587 (+),score=126.18 TRINITY_DN7275_c0_g1_i4:32-1792(+)
MNSTKEGSQAGKPIGGEKGEPRGGNSVLAAVSKRTKGKKKTVEGLSEKVPAPSVAIEGLKPKSQQLKSSSNESDGQKEAPQKGEGEEIGSRTEEGDVGRRERKPVKAAVGATKALKPSKVDDSPLNFWDWTKNPVEMANQIVEADEKEMGNGKDGEEMSDQEELFKPFNSFMLSEGVRFPAPPLRSVAQSLGSAGENDCRGLLKPQTSTPSRNFAGVSRDAQESHRSWNPDHHNTSLTTATSLSHLERNEYSASASSLKFNKFERAAVRRDFFENGAGQSQIFPGQYQPAFFGPPAHLGPMFGHPGLAGFPVGSSYVNHSDNGDPFNQECIAGPFGNFGMTAYSPFPPSLNHSLDQGYPINMPMGMMTNLGPIFEDQKRRFSSDFAPGRMPDAGMFTARTRQGEQEKVPTSGGNRARVKGRQGGTGKGKRVNFEDEECTMFEIDPERIETYSKTTLMIKNIPNKYDQTLLLETIDKNYRDQYDFFYLPIDFTNKCNVGYAFINFVDTRFIRRFFEEFNGKRWEKFNSEKICLIKYARIQGREALIQHFQYSSVMHQADKKLKPVILPERDRSFIETLVTLQKAKLK